MGLERLCLLLEASENLPEKTALADVYLVSSGSRAEVEALKLAESLRENLSLRVLTHCGGGSFKSQFKKADRSGARVALVIGESEAEQGVVQVKWLREEREQQQLAMADVVSELAAQLD